MIRSCLKKWATLLKNKEYRRSLFVSFVIVALSYLIYNFVIEYVDGLKGLPAITDTLHEVLPLWDLRFIYIYGMVGVFAVLLLYFAIFKPELFPFYLKVFGLVYGVRSLCITLTHLGPPEGFLIPTFASDYKLWLVTDMLHSNDLFFSGHVAYPFMGALLVKDLNRGLFYLFLVLSFVMAFTVLSMRIHYSIDVISAYFYVFGVYMGAKFLFGKSDLVFNKLIK